MSCQEQWTAQADRLAEAARVASSQVDGGLRCDRPGCTQLVNRATQRCLAGHAQGEAGAAAAPPELAAGQCLLRDVVARLQSGPASLEQAQAQAYLREAEGPLAYEQGMDLLDRILGLAERLETHGGWGWRYDSRWQAMSRAVDQWQRAQGEQEDPTLHYAPGWFFHSRDLPERLREEAKAQARGLLTGLRGLGVPLQGTLIPARWPRHGTYLALRQADGSDLSPAQQELLAQLGGPGFRPAQEVWVGEAVAWNGPVLDLWLAWEHLGNARGMRMLLRAPEVQAHLLAGYDEALATGRGLLRVIQVRNGATVVEYQLQTEGDVVRAETTFAAADEAAQAGEQLLRALSHPDDPVVYRACPRCGFSLAPLAGPHACLDDATAETLLQQVYGAATDAGFAQTRTAYTSRQGRLFILERIEPAASGESPYWTYSWEDAAGHRHGPKTEEPTNRHPTAGAAVARLEAEERIRGFLASVPGELDRATYEAACARLGVVPLADNECLAYDVQYGEYELPAHTEEHILAMKLAWQRAVGIYGGLDTAPPAGLPPEQAGGDPEPAILDYHWQRQTPKSRYPGDKKRTACPRCGNPTSFEFQGTSKSCANCGFDNEWERQLRIYRGLAKQGRQAEYGDLAKLRRYVQGWADYQGQQAARTSAGGRGKKRT